jgi:hypothetical protein
MIFPRLHSSRLVQIQATTPARVSNATHWSVPDTSGRADEGHTPPGAPGETLRISNGLENELRRSLSMMQNVGAVLRRTWSGPYEGSGRQRKKADAHVTMVLGNHLNAEYCR